MLRRAWSLHWHHVDGTKWSGFQRHLCNSMDICLHHLFGPTPKVRRFAHWICVFLGSSCSEQILGELNSPKRARKKSRTWRPQESLAASLSSHKASMFSSGTSAIYLIYMYLMSLPHAWCCRIQVSSRPPRGPRVVLPCHPSLSS